MDLEFFNKHILMPQVVVYKNMFEKKELNNFLSILKKYENDIKNFEKTSGNNLVSNNHGINPIYIHENENPLKIWVPWYDYGKKTILTNKNMPEEIKNLDFKFLYEFKNKILKNFNIIFQDYKNEWSNQSDWPNYLDDWNKLELGEIEILKHNIFLEREFIIEYHTDTPFARLNEPGFIQFLTITFYINDNYQGGEIDFVSEKENKLITYKPQAGDVTVFPSGPPYWHAAKAAKGPENKFFIRVFMSFNNLGDSDWFKNIEKYGLEEWTEINKERIKKELKNGMYSRQIIKEGFKKDNTISAKPIYIKNEDCIYIDGKNI